MLKNILTTFSSKIIGAIISFFLVVLTTRYLGASGRGAVSIVTASAGLLAIFSGFIGGAALIYLIPRNKTRMFLKQAMVLSYLWAIIVSAIGISIFYYSKSVSTELLLHIFILGILSSILNTNTIILLAREKILTQNILSLTISILNCFAFGFLVVAYKSVTINLFLISFYASLLTGICISFAYLYIIWKGLSKEHSSHNLLSSAMDISKYGFISQMGNVLQYMNYRLSYYILNYFAGSAQVGVYSVGVVLSEAIWMVSGSIALVQYSKIANAGDNAYTKDLTIKLSKFSFVTTLLCVLVLLSIPEDIIGFIFGRDFAQVKKVLWALFPGITSFGLTVIISHYFAGIGKYKTNTFAACIGLIVTVPGNLVLIPRFGYLGAGITASLSYLITSIFLFFSFVNIADISLSSFKLGREDLNTTIRLLGRLKGSKA